MKQNSSHDADSVALFKSWLTEWMVQDMGIDREKIDSRQSFLSYGMDSVQAMTMVGDLEAKLEVRLPPTLAWDFPDIDALSNHLADRMISIASPAPAAARQPEISSIASPAKIDGLPAEHVPLGDRDIDDMVQPYVESAR
jgi:acyl carrier protein